MDQLVRQNFVYIYHQTIIFTEKVNVYHRCATVRKGVRNAFSSDLET